MDMSEHGRRQRRLEKGFPLCAVIRASRDSSGKQAYFGGDGTLGSGDDLGSKKGKHSINAERREAVFVLYGLRRGFPDVASPGPPAPSL